MDFDLGKLTLVGWLVLLITTAIIITGIAMVAMSSGGAEIAETRGGKRIIAFILLGVGAGFFVACKYGLAKIGLPMFRS